MTIRKMLLMVLILMSIIVVGLNAFILTTLTDRYFKDYLKESYDLHIQQILDYTKEAMIDENVSYKQMAIELETHLIDPIIKIKVYNEESDLLVEVGSDYYLNGNMMNPIMGKRFAGNNSSEEVIQYEIKDGSRTVGKLNVMLHSVAENSFVARRFKGSLLLNSLFAVIIAIIIAILMGVFVSKKMSRSLQETAKIASNIQLGIVSDVKSTSIKEINAIRESLDELNSRLKLKQKSRKVLIDQLIHQTRTPLTILKSHLEAIEDGLIEVTDEEIGTCQNQIEIITAMISNMSSMIDANKETEEIHIETFELNQMLKQILIGFKAQFTKKNISLELVSTDKVSLLTDKDKFSQSIYNVLTNAYKYTGKYGHVRVSYVHLDNRLILKIQDTGIGISQNEQDKIFRAYYRGFNTPLIEGDGIGLYIVKENLAKFCGTINVNSKVKVGSTFTIEIPIKLSQE